LIAAITAMTLIGVALASSVLALRYRSAALAVSQRESAFVAPPSPQPVFQAAVFTLLAGLIVTDAVGDAINHEWLWYLDVALATLWVLLVAALWRAAGGGYGVRLRPDGVLNRQFLGSHFIPWDAFAPAFPVSVGSQSLTANYERPDLVRRRGLGLSRDTLPATVDPAFIAQVVPERRSAIGSEQELHRITAGTGI
jgi:hypothetical protein